MADIKNKVAKEEAVEDTGLMTINCAYPVKVNGVEYFGHVTVDKKLGETIVEMLSKKRHAEMMVHIGKEHEYQRLIDGTKIIVDANTKRRI